jgi:hypothetical protein
MSFPSEPNYPDSHHYPPSTADWVTSPLTAEDELPHNPLERANTSMPGLRLGAQLVIAGGLLAVAGSVMQWIQVAQVAPWYLWLVLFTGCMAIGAVGGSLVALFRAASKRSRRVISFTFTAIALQIAEIVVTLAETNAHAASGGGILVSVGSVLTLLAGGLILRSGDRSKMSRQDRVDQAEGDRQMQEFIRNGKTSNIPFGPRSGPFV